jgi:hypothetical protein
MKLNEVQKTLPKSNNSYAWFKGLKTLGEDLADYKNPNFLCDRSIELARMGHSLNPYKSTKLLDDSQTQKPKKIFMSHVLPPCQTRKKLKNKLDPLIKLNSQNIVSSNQTLGLKKFSAEKLLNANRKKLNFLKSQLNKKKSNISVLDFWSDDMKINASKIISNEFSRKPAGQKAEIVDMSLRKGYKKLSMLNSEEFFSSSYNVKIDKIINVCDDTQKKTQELKDKLSLSMLNIKYQF